jgi:hypothetical protein
MFMFITFPEKLVKAEHNFNNEDASVGSAVVCWGPEDIKLFNSWSIFLNDAFIDVRTEFPEEIRIIITDKCSIYQINSGYNPPYWKRKKIK